MSLRKKQKVSADVAKPTAVSSSSVAINDHVSSSTSDLNAAVRAFAVPSARVIVPGAQVAHRSIPLLFLIMACLLTPLVMAAASDPKLLLANQPGVIANSHFARVQYPAPDFSADAVYNNEFTTIKLDSYRGKWVVLFFYPLDFTFVCPTEIIAFSDRVEEFKELNTQVIAASVDSKHSHLAWINQPRKDGGLGSMNIPIISDITKQIAYNYGVLIEHGPDIGLSLRGTFIIDPEGIIRHLSVNDLGVGRSVDEVLRLLEALQYNAEHGEVCPAGWKKGDKTMHADPKKSKDYFQSVFGKKNEL